jgi:hypothetical protein
VIDSTEPLRIGAPALVVSPRRFGQEAPNPRLEVRSASGVSWPELHVDWIGVLAAIDRLAAVGAVRAFHLHGVHSGPATLLAAGSRTSIDWVTPAGEVAEPDQSARERLREQIAANLAADLAASGPL